MFVCLTGCFQDMVSSVTPWLSWNLHCITRLKKSDCFSVSWVLVSKACTSTQLDFFGVFCFCFVFNFKSQILLTVYLWRWCLNLNLRISPSWLVIRVLLSCYTGQQWAGSIKGLRTDGMPRVCCWPRVRCVEVALCWGSTVSKGAL